MGCYHTGLCHARPSHKRLSHARFSSDPKSVQEPLWGGGVRASHEPLSPCSLYLKYQVLACFDKQMPLETGFVTPPAFQDTGNSTEVRLSLQNHLSPGGSATVCWHRWNGHALMSGCPTSMPKRPGPFLARTTWKLSATASTKLCGASDFGHRSN